MALRRMGVLQLTSPTPRAGASRTAAVWFLALALAIAVAVRAAWATASGVRELVAENPQAPLAITRTPTPVDSVLTTLWTIASRVTMNWFRYRPTRTSA
jgi:hypothetical protein